MPARGRNADPRAVVEYFVWPLKRPKTPHKIQLLSTTGSTVHTSLQLRTCYPVPLLGKLCSTFRPGRYAVAASDPCPLNDSQFAQSLELERGLMPCFLLFMVGDMI